MRKVEVFCPKCGYRPNANDVWMCEVACGCIWNTFDTCGVCPQCGKNWEETQCLACRLFSPHKEWYHETLPDAVNEEEVAVSA